jgi:flagella basal body P-ring formation protein FlgA
MNPQSRPLVAPARALRAAIALLFLAPSSLLAFDLAPEVRRIAQAETERLPGRVEIEVGAAKEHSRLAPCRRAKPYLPAGARLWGRAWVGVRCEEGATWNVLVPVHVRVYAPALVAAHALAAGEPLRADALRSEETDLTREREGALLDPRDAASYVLARPVAAGTVLRRDHVRMPIVLAQGELVRVIYAGRGFTVSASGKAMQSAVAGAQVRVQLESGRILTGWAREDRVVEVR